MRSWKSHRLTSLTWLGLNPQIRRPLPRIVGAIAFLLSMNDVTDFVISKKRNLSIFWTNWDFLSGKYLFLLKKNSVALTSAVCRDFMAVQMKILSVRFLKYAFKLETSPFGSLKELV
jgi:hypothetical protein